MQMSWGQKELAAVKKLKVRLGKGRMTYGKAGKTGRSPILQGVVAKEGMWIVF